MKSLLSSGLTQVSYIKGGEGGNPACPYLRFGPTKKYYAVELITEMSEILEVAVGIRQSRLPKAA